MRRWITTESVLEYDAKNDSYTEVINKGYWYEGEVAECKGGSKSSTSSNATTSVNTTNIGLENIQAPTNVNGTQTITTYITDGGAIQAMKDAVETISNDLLDGLQALLSTSETNTESALDAIENASGDFANSLESDRL